jgi:hypothetical protein
MEGGFSCAFEEQLNGRSWRSRDAMASEFEVGDFLHGLIRLIKPKVIIETGYYKGDSTLPMAKACYTNCTGLIHACDTQEPPFHVPTLWGSHVQLYPITKGVELCAAIKDVDLAFLDSSGDRLAEAEALQMANGGIIVLHDANRPVYEHMKALGWAAMKFPTPRGLGIFQT